ncbi:glucitol operon activator protein [Propionispira arboris]|uniref:Glucitol operon activator protein n=1 Tax=Propionispira arboris TaxID=84035 RepID=A0A1H6YCI5_9FIRM|nr:transcriptional regulator GutM [Propionispira arboris]SEJ37614.1 glucitol operon activator protein [Propionispira arboris]
MEFTTLIAVLLIFMLIQASGTYLQVKQYKKAVRRLHKIGNVGIGSRKSKLRPGNIVVIACNNQGEITGGEIMEGFTIFNGFKELNDIIGKNIYDLKAEYMALPEKKQKIYQAHVQAIDALDMRLNSIKT